MYGTIFTAVEPAVRAAVLNVGGASAVDVARWSPAYHLLATEMLYLRVPSLLNLHGSYDEDYVLPEQPPHITTFRGAMAIQNVFENLEWLSMQGDPMAFAPHLSVSPLATTTARSVLFQFARADRTMPNPASSGLIRAAGGAAGAWIYRHDLARAEDPSLPLDPHPYLVLFVSLNGSTIQLPGLDALSISLGAQGQDCRLLGRRRRLHSRWQRKPIRGSGGGDFRLPRFPGPHLAARGLRLRWEE